MWRTASRKARRRNGATAISNQDATAEGGIDSARATVYNARGIRRVNPTHRWRGGRVAEGGGLLMRYRPSRPIPLRPRKDEFLRLSWHQREPLSHSIPLCARALGANLGAK